MFYRSLWFSVDFHRSFRLIFIDVLLTSLISWWFSSFISTYRLIFIEVLSISLVFCWLSSFISTYRLIFIEVLLTSLISWWFRRSFRLIDLSLSMFYWPLWFPGDFHRSFRLIDSSSSKFYYVGKVSTRFECFQSRFTITIVLIISTIVLDAKFKTESTGTNFHIPYRWISGNSYQKPRSRPTFHCNSWTDSLYNMC